MVDGFGAAFQFAIQDTAAVENIIAAIKGLRNGADNTGKLVLSTYSAGVIGDRVEINATGLSPFASDGLALGSTTLMWSDLFLASGGVINFNNGNATLTHSAGLITSNVALSLGTSNAFTTGTIELGAASDTTISRVSAGVIAVEGVNVLLNGGALGTPSSGTLTNCTGLPVAGITSSTSTALGVGSLELGAASDTTLSRTAAGILAVEGEVLNGYTTTATAAGTTTLTITATRVQYFTGSTTQTVKLPTTSVVLGQTYVIKNNSTGSVTVQSSGANTIVVLGAGQAATFTALAATPTTAANWDFTLVEATGNNNAITASANAATINLALPRSRQKRAPLSLSSQRDGKNISKTYPSSLFSSQDRRKHCLLATVS
jgi:hypothetical protein